MPLRPSEGIRPYLDKGNRVFDTLLLAERLLPELRPVSAPALEVIWRIDVADLSALCRDFDRALRIVLKPSHVSTEEDP